MVWIKPSIGLFAGVAAGNKDEKKGGNAGLMLGNLAIQLGGLLGGMIGWGEKWGFYTGVNGALSFIPWLGFGFLCVPVGIHFNKRFGLGIIIPIWMTQWWIGLVIGVAAFLIASLISKNN